MKNSKKKKKKKEEKKCCRYIRMGYHTPKNTPWSMGSLAKSYKFNENRCMKSLHGDMMELHHGHMHNFKVLHHC